ncbi:DUF4038 domain-containing protein [Herbiconiux sp. KACC 21604]|uniref:apiosidase-like domain-containing protein n=1 Tax=unclassified Herbiconiux TaxID=2618217 RepID=UPI001492B340|nr:DUF4038 domain-containing protein [Herbiconiux sp. SALV-R1]QJU55015.1 DUF4038 domain-containing protein [Herbiconiux sp. SALV-R1]WPO86150.1 DUF4038 domain-containing protein [Herbiconiux sp. KACC 21604]
MTLWTIAPDHRSLLADGEHRFLLADTTWAAFTSPTDAEWLDHLELRRRQGFNALLISVLPIAHDRSEASRTPFSITDGAVDFDGGDADFWSHAEWVLDEARERGFTPVLVLLWNNFVPGTWGAGLTPDHVLTEQQTVDYVRLAVRTFGRFDPVFAISGDDDLNDAEAIERYSLAARIVREEAPDALITWHDTPTARMPKEVADGPLIDLHGLQSGHNEAWDTLPADLTRYYRALDVERPVVNLEPCYEGLGRFAGASRHRRSDVRRASWTGVVAGASAGLGYGAHGVWSWHRRGAAFTAEAVHGTPFPFSVAAGFEGALDAAFVRQVVEGENLFGLVEDPSLLVAEPSGAVAGRVADDVVVVYAPEPFALTLRLDRPVASVTVYDLERRQTDAVHTTAVDAGLRVEQPEFLGDALYVLRLEAASR